MQSKMLNLDLGVNQFFCPFSKNLKCINFPNLNIYKNKAMLNKSPNIYSKTLQYHISDKEYLVSLNILIFQPIVLNFHTHKS